MSHYFALLSIVYMMGFVFVFDKFHLRRRNLRFWKTGLMSGDEVDQLVRIMAACEDAGAARTSACAIAPGQKIGPMSQVP